MPFHSRWQLAVLIAVCDVEDDANELIDGEEQPHQGGCAEDAEQNAGEDTKGGEEADAGDSESIGSGGRYWQLLYLNCEYATQDNSKCTAGCRNCGGQAELY